MADIFISYAHLDNQPFSGSGYEQEKGWITHFVNNLRNCLNRKMGRADASTLWMDYRLKGCDCIPQEIAKEVEQAYTLVLFLSKAWLASSWCTQELDLFSKHLSSAHGRIFVVELDRIPRDEKPKMLQDLKAYRFWKKTDQEKIQQLGFPVPRDSDTSYFNEVVDIADDLEKTLRIKKDHCCPTPVQATVYIAPVPDSLYEQRTYLVTALSQYHIATLPHTNDEMSSAERATIFAQCSHYIQLLNGEWAMGIPKKHFDAAQESTKPILQWRCQTLNCNDASISPEQRHLLKEKTVMASTLSDFITHVCTAVLPPPSDTVPNEIQHANASQKMIFIHASQEDFQHAEYIAKHLCEQGFGIILPRYKDTPAGIRTSVQRGYELCDTLLMLQQNTSAQIIEDLLCEMQRYNRQRREQANILLCRCAEAEALHFIPPRTTIFTCQDAFEQQCLKQFFEVQA